MNNFIYQTNETECGFACLKMLLSITYKKDSYLYIPNLETNNKQYSILDLKNISNKYGAELETVKYESLDEINITKPFIYIKTNENNNYHCILVKKKNKKTSLIYDPDKGKRYVKNNDFYTENEHIVCYIKSSKDVEFKSENLYDKSNILFLSIFQLLSIFLIFFGMFMVDQSNEKKKLVFSISFIVMGLIISLIQRIFIYKLMDEYDSKFIEYIHTNNNVDTKNNFKLMNDTKTYIFTNDSKILTNLIVSVFINVALFINNNKTIYLSILILILVFIDVLFLSNFNDKKSLINKNEDVLLNSNKTNEEFVSSFNNLKEDTYKFAKLIDIKRLIFYSLIFIISFILFMFSTEHLISALILYFFSGTISYNYLNEIINIIENNKINIINKTKFLTLVNTKKMEK